MLWDTAGGWAREIVCSGVRRVMVRVKVDSIGEDEGTTCVHRPAPYPEIISNTVTITLLPVVFQSCSIHPGVQSYQGTRKNVYL